MKINAQDRPRYIAAGLLIVAAAMFFVPVISYMGISVSMRTMVNMLGKMKGAGGIVGGLLGLDDEYEALSTLANMRFLFCLPYLFALAAGLMNLFVTERIGRLATVIVGIFNIVLMLGAVLIGQSSLNNLLGEWMFALDMVDISVWKILGVGFWIFLICQLAAAVLSAMLMMKRDSAGYQSTEDIYMPEREAALDQREQAPARERAGSLQGLKGEYAGMRLSIGIGENILIGRDAKVCNLVLTNTKISRRHCAISYIPETDRYTLTDYSSTGTFLADGKRIQPNSPMEVMAGTVISLGDQENMFRIG